MDIKGLDYNTQREKLIMPEYGREIQKMVDFPPRKSVCSAPGPSSDRWRPKIPS